MTAAQEIEWEQCLITPTRDRELERYAKRTFGLVPDFVPYLARCPWIARAMVEFDRSLFQLRYFKSDISEMIALVVSQDNACRYCYAATRSMLRILGFSERRIQRLEQDLSLAELNPRDKLALDFARRVSRANPLPSSPDLQRLREHGHADGATKEIAYAAAAFVFNNRVSTLSALPTERMERLPESLKMRLFRPLYAWIMQSYMKRESPEGAPEQQTGPFSYIVLALAELPIARTLRRVLDEAWSSAILAPRAKALVFAVIARALGSTLAEREASNLLRKEGFSETAIEEILSHLSSPALDPVETVLLPFARESISYQPAKIQRRGRVVRDRLGEEQFLELIGVAALANAVCRLEVVAGDA